MCVYIYIYVYHSPLTSVWSHVRQVLSRQDVLPVPRLFHEKQREPPRTGPTTQFDMMEHSSCFDTFSKLVHVKFSMIRRKTAMY